MKQRPGIKYTHTNLVARDWRCLVKFYTDVLGCIPVPPERNYSGEWLEKITGIKGARLEGTHLRLPGYGADGPTLEIFQYASMPEHPIVKANTPGFSHLAFAVDDVEKTARDVIKSGGSAVGELTVREIPGVGALIVQYLADPEGNIIEIQKWGKNSGQDSHT